MPSTRIKQDLEESFGVKAAPEVTPERAAKPDTPVWPPAQSEKSEEKVEKLVRLTQSETKVSPDHASNARAKKPSGYLSIFEFVFYSLLFVGVALTTAAIIIAFT